MLLHSVSIPVCLTVIQLIFLESIHYSHSHSTTTALPLFHSRLKTCTFHKPLLPQIAIVHHSAFAVSMTILLTLHTHQLVHFRYFFPFGSVLATKQF